jgi:tetratricopeptide (TPR) repeat protein
MPLLRITRTLLFFGLISPFIHEGFSQSQEVPDPQTQSEIPWIETPGLLPTFVVQKPTQKTAKKTDASYRLEKVKEWRQAALRHNPGKADASALTFGSWPGKDLDIAINYVTKLAAQPLSSLKRIIKKDQNRSALGLTDQEVQQGNLNRILKQGALLHTDIALLELEPGRLQDTKEQIGLYIDGRVVVMPKKIHWDFARRLIDSIAPHPSKDPLARHWYIAATAHMLSGRLLAYAGQNLKNALEIFPSDDRILFYAGVLHETWASPLLQNTQLPPLALSTYGSKESELKLAKQFLAKAVAANPNFSEAHLHLGRVLGLLDCHQESIANLQLAHAAIKDPQLLYYTSLYLGYELTMLSRFKEAREQFERAAMLFPTAQSPLLALSQLAHNRNDSEGALFAIQRVFTLPRNDFWKDDPWWIYNLSHVRDASALLEEMYRMFGELPR